MPIKGSGEEIRVIKRLISIFDRYSKLYKKISNGKFEKYEEYIRVGFIDEEELIKPKLWLDFLNEILCFPKDEYIPEYPEQTGLTPDFTPRDLRAHPFIFEIKGSDCQDLSIHYKKVTDYIKPPIRWAVLTNMHQLVVYEKDFHLPVSDYSFDFLLLYKTFKSQPRKILEYDNTKKFLNFIERFKYREFTLQDKIEKIKEGIPWTGQEVLDADALIESIRKIVAWLYDDIKKYRPHLTDTLHFLPRNQVEFAQEIESIARELDRRRPFVKVSVEDLKTFMKAKLGTIEYQAVEIFLMRVAYFAMTRILIARMWEDIGLLEQILYDGGFRIWYERLENRIQEVLRMAFSFAAKQYSWLYAAPNNYNWYIPSEEVIINVLYEFSKYNLGKLNTDVLGTVYEKYVDDIDRKNKGQYYTPREIISLIWDLVGFKDETKFFNYENGKRKPKLIFDPAVGSAGFLVEAARRIQELSHYNEKELEDLYEVFQSLYDGLFGCDISLFAYYIAEVNLIIQITPIIKNIRTIAKNLLQLPFTLGLIPYDSLALHNPKLIGVSDPNAYIRNSKDPYERLNPLTDKYKKDVLDRIRETKDFDYVCSNPPYIGEKGHKDLFRRTIESYPYWQEYYQGKMDYFYFFIILGLSKLKEGGKLGFITTSYWPTADGASKLRKYILDNAFIQTIIDFGETKIFEGAPGQHNMIFILERCSSYEQGLVKFPIEEIIKKKSMHQIKIVKVKKLPEMNNNSMNNHHRIRLKKLVDLIKIHIDKEQYSDDYIEVFYSAVKQGELDGNPWNTIWSRINMDKIFGRNSKDMIPLKNVLEVKQGIVPGVDRITNENIKYLPTNKITKENIKIGDGVFILTEEELNMLSLNEYEKQLFVPSYHNRHITPYLVDIPKDETDFILYIDAELDFEKHPNIKRHLDKYKEILKARIERYEERGYKETYEWYRLNRPRDRKILSNEKIVVSNWGTSWQPFAYQSGQFFEKRDITFFVKKGGVKESLFYFLGLLNSSLLRWWMTEKARQLGYMRQSLQEQIPIRRIDFSNPDEKKIHNNLVKRVEKIIELKKELAQYNKFFKGVRLTKLEGPEKLPEPDIYAITVSLPQEDQRILRTHQKVSWEPKEIEDFYLSKTGKIEEVAPLFTGKEEEPVFSIKLLSKDKKQISINAPKEIVNYLQEILQNYIGKSWEEIKKIPIAKDLKTYQAKEKEIIQQVKVLLSQIEKTQNEIDEIVYDLYQISPEEKKIIQDAVKDRKETN
uniref:site-specific DNA-methyltransferase (adenine-specific) n=1 Tax=candidate division WOR-3 bacterium TaxID=2052148 RepID=A0A7V3RI72_UNCW3